MRTGAGVGPWGRTAQPTHSRGSAIKISQGGWRCFYPLLGQTMVDG